MNGFILLTQSKKGKNKEHKVSKKRYASASELTVKLCLSCNNNSCVVTYKNKKAHA